MAFEKNQENKINFEKEEKQDEEEGSEKEMSMGDMQGNVFIKNPAVGEEILLKVQKVVRNKNTTGKNRETGAEFTIGLENKKGGIMRYDIHTENGVYTVSSWEVYFKLFGPDGLLMKYAKKNLGKFSGAEVKIKHLVDGRHASMDFRDLMKIRDCNEEAAKKYQSEIKMAMKERKIYDISLV